MGAREHPKALRGLKVLVDVNDSTVFDHMHAVIVKPF